MFVNNQTWVRFLRAMIKLFQLLLNQQIVMIYHLLFIIIYFSNVKLVCMELIEHKTNSCVIIGRKLKTCVDQKPYEAFWKIPYAKPPIGDLRFKVPIFDPTLILENTVHNFSIPYTDSCFSYKSEDCLFLSIYKPENLLNTVPVFVWLHEESFEHGPDFFIEEEVIVVTVSFRTGILGFLNTDDEFCSGNMGAKDIVTALKWLRNNIGFFNGDVNKVTVAGSSIASNIVASLVLSPNADDLFDRVIIHSGSALSPSEYSNVKHTTLQNLQFKLTGNYERIIKKLMSAVLSMSSLSDLKYLSQYIFDSTEIRNLQRLVKSFGLTIETINLNCFMNKHPQEVYKRLLVNNDVSIMMGFTNYELLHKLQKLATQKFILQYLDYNFHYLVPFNGRADEFESERYKKIKKQIKEFYFINGTITARSFKRYAKYMSDQIIYPILSQARIHSKSSRKEVFVYRFSLNGSLNSGLISSAIDFEINGATAHDEICYLFRCKSFDEIYKSTKRTFEKQFIKKIVRLWTNFAKYDNPTPTVEDLILENLQWEPLLKKKGNMKVMNLGQTMGMIRLPEQKRMKFWDRLKEDFFSNLQ